MHLFLAVISYSDIKPECAESLLHNTHILRDSGFKVMPYFHSGDCYIARARNVCVQMFLESECSDLLFVDSDVAFEPSAMLKLIKHDKDIVAGAYPYRKSVREYPVKIRFDEKTRNCLEQETGLVTAENVPTGFMRIRRRVFEKLITHCGLKPDSHDLYPFFDTGMIFPDDNTWYGEDVAFCKRWRSIGGEIFIDPDIDMTHIGTQKFTGNYHKYLLSLDVNNFADIDKVKKGIRGWMSEPELALLRYFASKSDSMAEIGCWKGRSTKELLESCKGVVYAVDHFNGSKTDETGILSSIATPRVYEEFLKNVAHYPNLKILKGDSADMANRFNGNKVDTVFIDAGHTYEECKKDIDSWLPKCSKIMAGHDYSINFPGVMQAVSERFDKVNVVDSIWWVELN